MKQFRFFIFALFLAACSKSSVYKEVHSISFTKYGRTGTPLIEVEIEGKTLLVSLDLGLRGMINLDSETTSRLQDRSFSHIETRYGITGGQYEKNFYRIPQLKLKDLTFNKNLLLQEHCDQFTIDNHFGLKEKKEEVGRVGWELFIEKCLVIDVAHNTMLVADALEETGYAPEDFAAAPLIFDNGAFEFDIQANGNPLRCVIDTGCTINILNKPLPEGQSLADRITDPEAVTTYSQVQVDNRALFPIVFHELPIILPIHLDAILGMEFIQEHLILIDFPNEMIYFSKNSAQM